MLNEVVVACSGTLRTDAAASLCTELCQRSTLDVAHVADGHHHLVVGIEVLSVELFGAGHDLCLALVGILLLHLYQFVLDNLAAQVVVGQDLIVVCNLCLQFVELVVQVLLAQTSQLAQAHVHDSLRLQFVQVEACLQVALCILRSLAGTDYTHHLIDVVTGDNQTLQDMCTFLGLAQFILCTADNHLMTVIHEVADAVLQCQQTGASLYQSDCVHAETGLQGCHLEQLVQHHTCIGIALHVNYNAHTLTVALVVGIAYALQLAFLHEFGNVFDELSLVHTVGNLCDHNLVVLVACLDIRLRTHNDTASAGLIGILYSLQAHDVGTCGEVGTLHMLHQSLGIHLWIVHVCHTGVNNLAQVVGGDVGCHTHGNTGSTVDQQVGDTCGHNGWLLQSVVEVVGHVHRLLLQILHHSLAHHAQTRLGVTHCCSTVAVHRTEVTLTVNQCVAHVPLLCHAHQGAIDRAVAMGMILTQHLTHDTCTLLVRFVVCIAQSLHTIEDTAVYGFETVTHIGQGTCHNDTHRVVDVAFPHLGLDVHFDDSFLIFHL